MAFVFFYWKDMFGIKHALEMSTKERKYFKWWQ